MVTLGRGGVVANRGGDMVEEKGRHNKMGDERDIWEKGGREKGGWGVEGRAGWGNEGRSWFSAEGALLLRYQCGTTQGLVIVKSYQLTMGHQGIRG